MRPTRLLATVATGALVAVPGFALAQGGPSETPPVETPPVETPATPDREVQEPEDPEEPEVEELEVEEQEIELEEADGEGHGPLVSALAQCLPSGRELHGTGLTKGFVMRQAAAGGPIELPGVGSFDIVEACAEVQRLADASQAPDTAKGRPHWAGPKGEVDAQDAGPGGRPPHAGQGRDKARGQG